MTMCTDNQTLGLVPHFLGIGSRKLFQNHWLAFLGRPILLLEYLTAQETNTLEEKVACLNDLMWYGSNNASDPWQVVNMQEN